MSDDPVDELAAVINETLRANGLRLTTRRGGYVGSGQPHASLDSDPGAVDNVARGLLARKVAEPSRALSSPETTPDRLEGLRVKEGDPAARMPYFDPATLIAGTAPETTPAGVLDEAALAKALEAIWPHHTEGVGSSPPSPSDHSYEVWEPFLPGSPDSVARALAAALGRSGSGGGRG